MLGATSPILRGAYIANRLLGINLTPDARRGRDAVASRARSPRSVRTHRVLDLLRQGAPNGHSTYINPPGFVLERYDPSARCRPTIPLGGDINATGDVYFSDTNTKTITTPSR